MLAIEWGICCQSRSLIVSCLSFITLGIWKIVPEIIYSFCLISVIEIFLTFLREVQVSLFLPLPAAQQSLSYILCCLSIFVIRCTSGNQVKKSASWEITFKLLFMPEMKYFTKKKAVGNKPSAFHRHWISLLF